MKSSVSPDSPRQLRALAHPLRLRLIGELRVSGPLTVGRLAEALDQSPGNVSYHLGVLASTGFVVEVPELATDARERWWRAEHDSTRIDRHNPATAGLRHEVIDVYAANLHRAIDAGDPAGETSDIVVRLTDAQLAAAAADLEEVLAKWAAVPAAEGARPAQLIIHAFRRP